MKKLTTVLLILLASTTFAMSENSEITCSKINQSNEQKEIVSAVSTNPAPVSSKEIRK